MSSLVDFLASRIIGIVHEVQADEITVQLASDAPRTTAINTGFPTGFPRINGYVLIPNEMGATICLVKSIKVEQGESLSKVKRELDFVDLPSSRRSMKVLPVGTLQVNRVGGDFQVKVQRGVDVFPSIGENVMLPNVDQLKAIVQGDEEALDKRVEIGTSPIAGNAPIYIDPNKIFGRHLAVLGNTGAGKSCSVAGIIRWSLEAAKKALANQTDNPNARFIILDPNGEYSKSFEDLGARVFKVESENDANQLKLPAWMWNGDEWASFTAATPGVQRPLLFEAIRRLRSGMGAGSDIDVETRNMLRIYRLRITHSRSDGDFLATGGRLLGPVAVLQGLIADIDNLLGDIRVTTPISTQLTNIRAIVDGLETSHRSGPRAGATGQFWYNPFTNQEIQGLIDTISAAFAALGGTENDDLGASEDSPIPFILNDLPHFVDALATDSNGRDVTQFVDGLRIRLRSIFRRDTFSKVINPNPTISLDSWLNNYVGEDKATNGTITVLDLSLVPSDLIHVVVGVISRLVFEAIQRYRRDTGNDLPTVLVLEEAHTFVHRDLGSEVGTPAGRSCYRTIERIAREGRKFGLGLVISSQRPSEVSSTVLSQCNTFLLHRLVNDIDQSLVKKLVPDGLGDILRELPSLPSRRAILVGWAAPAPVLVEMKELRKEHRPRSSDPRYWEVWTGKLPEDARAINWAALVKTWTSDNVEEAGADTAPPTEEE